MWNGKTSTYRSLISVRRWFKRLSEHAIKPELLAVCGMNKRPIIMAQPIPVASQPKAWALGHSLAGLVGANAARGMDICFECCQVVISATI
jgi:hypothetical protein